MLHIIGLGPVGLQVLVVHVTKDLVTMSRGPVGPQGPIVHVARYLDP